MSESSEDQALDRLVSESKSRTVTIGPKTIVVTVLVVATLVAALANGIHNHAIANKVSPKTSPVGSVSGTASSATGNPSSATTTPSQSTATGTTAQIVGPSSSGGTVMNSQGSVSSQTVYAASVVGTKTICDGKEVAPTATGCTASGGVIFGAEPQFLNKQGHDTNP